MINQNEAEFQNIYYETLLYVTLYHKPLLSLPVVSFVFYIFRFRFLSLTLKWYIVVCCLYPYDTQKWVCNSLIFFDTQLSLTVWSVTQNHICRLYEYFVVHGHMYKQNNRSSLFSCFEELSIAHIYERNCCEWNFLQNVARKQQ